MDLKKVVVLVITYNGIGDIEECLESLKTTTDQGITLLVIDNGSVDETAKVVERRAARAIFIKNAANIGYAGAVAQGVAWSAEHGYAYLAVVNQDIRVTKQWAEPLIHILDTDEVCGAVQPRILLYPDTERINSYGNTIHYLGFGYTLGYQKNTHEYPCQSDTPLASCSGATVMFRLSAVSAAGGIDPSFFMYYEDSDLSWRLRMAGFSLRLACSSTVYHRYEFSKSIKKFYYMERNRLLMILKNYSARTLFLIFPMMFIMECGVILYGLIGSLVLRRTSLTFWEKLKGYAFFFKPTTWVTLGIARRHAQQMRVIPDDQLIDLFCDTIEFQDVDNPILRYIVNPMTHQYWRIIKKII